MNEATTVNALPASTQRRTNDIDLKGQTAIVTGGTAGLGLSIARRLASSGAKVWSWDPIEPKEEEKGISHVTIDVTSRASIEAALERLGGAGAVDILVNNAGITGPSVPLDAYPEESWRAVIEVDLFGVFHCVRAVLPAMVARNYGRIVNIASIAGKEGIANGTAYAAAKGAVIALTKALAKELTGTPVLVNAVAPAAFRTSLWDGMDPDMLERALSQIPLRRLGEPDELASLVAWLSSAECSFNSGAVFDISGGRATY